MDDDTVLRRACCGLLRLVGVHQGEIPPTASFIGPNIGSCRCLTGKSINGVCGCHVELRSPLVARVSPDSLSAVVRHRPASSPENKVPRWLSSIPVLRRLDVSRTIYVLFGGRIGGTKQTTDGAMPNRALRNVRF